MAISDEHFSPGGDHGTELTPEVVQAFMRHAVWPAANRLWGGNFLKDSLPGESLKIERIVVDPESGEPGAIYGFLAKCVTDTDMDSGEGVVVRSVELSVVEHKPEATAGLLADINRQHQDLRRKSTFPVAPIKGMSAWLNTEYTFSDDPLEPYYVEPFFELRDSYELDALWDRTAQDQLRMDALEALAEPSDEAIPQRSHEEHILFMQLEDELPPVFTAKDLKAVCEALETLKLL